MNKKEFEKLHKWIEEASDEVLLDRLLETYARSKVLRYICKLEEAEMEAREAHLMLSAMNDRLRSYKSRPA